MATMMLLGSVGAGKAKGGRPHNDPDDFRRVRDRLVALGYAWVAGIASGSDAEFIRAVKLFQCICQGRHKLDKGDGRVSRCRRRRRGPHGSRRAGHGPRVSENGQAGRARRAADAARCWWARGRPVDYERLNVRHLEEE